MRDNVHDPIEPEEEPPVEPSGASLTKKRLDQAASLAGARITWASILKLLQPKHGNP